MYRKRKSVAVWLAILFGGFAWIYTYRVDGWKFWTNLMLSFVTLGLWGLVVAWPWAIIEAAIRPSEFYKDFPV